MNQNLNVVILAGGEGTRFAPYSTPECPKQFLPILDENRTMIQQTFDRVRDLVPSDKILISTHERYLPLVRQQLPDVAKVNCIGEPVKKNTAPAICLLTQLICMQDPQAVLLFFPADHYIEDQQKASDLFAEAAEIVSQSDTLLTFGVPPTFASTDYGYIKLGNRSDASQAYHVEKFVEKPDLVTAEQYIKSGSYVWNSGMFAWRGKVLLEACDKYFVQVHELLKSVGGGDLLSYFEHAPSISIDYAIMEKADNVINLPFTAGWSDIGTWQGLGDLARRYQLNLPKKVNEILKQFKIT